MSEIIWSSCSLKSHQAIPRVKPTLSIRDSSSFANRQQRDPACRALAHTPSHEVSFKVTMSCKSRRPRHYCRSCTSGQAKKNHINCWGAFDN